MTNDTLTQKRIRVRIPRNYHQEPVISRLVSDFGLTVNITAAVLGANAIGDGWFDLGLQGSATQIENGLTPDFSLLFPQLAFSDRLMVLALKQN